GEETRGSRGKPTVGEDPYVGFAGSPENRLRLNRKVDSVDRIGGKSAPILIKELQAHDPRSPVDTRPRRVCCYRLHQSFPRRACHDYSSRRHSLKNPHHCVSSGSLGRLVSNLIWRRTWKQPTRAKQGWH